MADITIRGAGIFGLSIAWACQSRGATVRVIDPAGVAAGSSGGLVGALAPHVPENWNPKKAFQFESLVMAEEFWGEVEQVSGLPSGYSRSGRVQPLGDAGAVELARKRSDLARELWQGRAEWNVMPAGDIETILPESPTGLFIFDTLSARLHPVQACRALATALTIRGAEICLDAQETGPVIHATGHRGLSDLGDYFGFPVGTGVKGQAALLDHDARNAPQIFADGLHIIPHFDGTIAIGSTSERDFSAPDETDERVDALIDKARTLVPELRDAPLLRTWAGVRPRVASRAPLIGAWPGRKGHFVANGGFKIGFGMAPKISEVMADLVLDNRAYIPPEFDSERQLRR